MIRSWNGCSSGCIGCIDTGIGSSRMDGETGRPAPRPLIRSKDLVNDPRDYEALSLVLHPQL